MLRKTSNSHTAADEAGAELWTVVKAVADMIAWLAGSNIVYTDVRGPSILVKEKRKERKRDRRRRTKERMVRLRRSTTWLTTMTATTAISPLLLPRATSTSYRA
jgi:hypothetical protein